jgi:hypothetical protein
MPAYALGMSIATLVDSKYPTVDHERVTTGGQLLEIKKLNTALFRRIGNLLVKSGFDEIPQVTTVLEGTMSIIGPRAITPEAMDSFLSQLPRTLLHEWRETMPNVKPGIVSTYALAEHGAENTKDRARMDIFDVKNASLQHDLYLLSHLGRTSAKPLLVPAEDYSEPTELTLVTGANTEPTYEEPVLVEESEEVA